VTSLNVWMDARHIAAITQSRGKMKLAYVAGVATLGVQMNDPTATANTA